METIKSLAEDPRSVLNDARSRSRLRRKARDLAEAGNFVEAVTYQQALADISPEDPQAFMDLGILHRAASEIEDAAVAFERAGALAPQTPDPHEAMAQMYLDVSRYDDAIKECKALLRLIPHSLAARDILRSAYFQKGAIGKALAITEEMIRIAPYDPLSHYKQAVLHQHRNDWRNALDKFITAAEMAPEESLERYEAEAAIEALDQHQVRQILQLASEDRVFQLRLIRDVDEAVCDRGYSISPAAMAFIGQVALSQIIDYSMERGADIYGRELRPQRYN